MTPAERVGQYLAAMENRDLDAASAMLHRDFLMTFPGGHCFSTLAELVTWSKSRYQRVGKHIERFDALTNSDTSIVYCFGTLHGEWLDGSPFSGIRFIDRFELDENTLLNQHVWNDMGEHRSP